MVLHEKESRTLSAHLAAKLIAASIIKNHEELTESHLKNIALEVEKSLSLNISKLKVEVLKICYDGKVSTLKCLELMLTNGYCEEAAIIVPLGFGFVLRVSCGVLTYG